MYAHLLARPYEDVTVRGVRIKRLRAARALSTGEDLAFETRCGIIDRMINPDPIGEATITVPEGAVDPYATVLALDFEGEPV